ncbi:outer membrane beta-barrel protein [Bosea sp. F3-2]|uniref:caspase family protein n=1 Tax=Bosea sp. F3-2 TaxID=2599640 RepID=UPI0011EFE9FA|nr:caspase family protein [Bosea sp. F3-2]QEL21297.1 outer membrane beta-barrel protein [Bosea sp. F3-2]
MRMHARAYAYLMAIVIVALAALGVGATPAFAQKRFAFIIGNGAYANVTKLPNALNDANATRAMLQDAGFDITPALDLSLAGLRSALDVFVDKVRQGGPDATALVYYAGHAVQLEGANYILPTDIRPQGSGNIASQSLSLSEILRRLDSVGAKSKFAILDACRDNPFAALELSRGLALQIVDGANEGIRSEAGLARVDSGSGTFVAFATSPGSTAADGTGANSPFTTAFLREAREPGLPVEQVFRRIRLAVYDATKGVQIPWDTSSLITDFSFFQRPAGASPQPQAGPGTIPLAAAARPSTATLRSMSPADAYRTAIAWDRRDIYRSVLDANPDDPNALRLYRILSQRTEETAWAETVLAGDAESFKLFARLYPGSTHVNESLRLAARAPSRNRVQVAQTCPVCPAVQPQPRTRRADYTPRAVSPARAGAPRRAPVTPPPVPVLPALLPERPRWTGFYVGGSLGGGSQTGRTTVGSPVGGPTVSSSTTTTTTTTTSTPSITTVINDATVVFPGTTTTVTTTSTVVGPTVLAPSAINPTAIPGSLSPNGAGAVGGAQFGFNYQIGAVVIGAETDISATRLGGSDNVSLNPGTRFTTRAENEVSMLGTVRARAGFVLGDFLIYGTGGYAYGLVDQKGSISPDNPATTSGVAASRSGIASGWALGGGVEYAILPGMTLRLDYTHYDLGNQKLTLQDYTGLAPTQYAVMRARTAGDIVKAGFNFGF